VKLFDIGGQHERDDVTISLLLPSLRRLPLTKYKMATNANIMIDEIECYLITLSPPPPASKPNSSEE
jgi:hypothetical protein